MGYRNHARIIGEILYTARDGDDGGATVTQLVRRANVPHARITGVLGTLVSRGLLEQDSSRGACRYRISRSGREFLQAYHEFASFADSFGLNI